MNEKLDMKNFELNKIVINLKKKSQFYNVNLLNIPFSFFNLI